jgi:excisionase family DNA binding protein
MPRHARPDTHNPSTRVSASSPFLVPDPPPVFTSRRPTVAPLQPSRQTIPPRDPSATQSTTATSPAQTPRRGRTTNGAPAHRAAPTLHEAQNLPATLSLIEAGRWLGIGRTTTYQLVQNGCFPIRTLRLGRQLRVATCDLLDYLNITIPYPAETPTAVADAA